MKSPLFVVHISGLNLTNIKLYVNCFEPLLFFLLLNVNKNIRSQKIANNHLHPLLLLSLCIFINTIEFSSQKKKKKDRILTYAFISSSYDIN